MNWKELLGYNGSDVVNFLAPYYTNKQHNPKKGFRIEGVADV